MSRYLSGEDARAFSDRARKIGVPVTITPLNVSNDRWRIVFSKEVSSTFLEQAERILERILELNRHSGRL